MATMKGGEILARMLKAHGVEYIFGMPWGQGAPYIATAIDLGVRWMNVRDEKCASLMATAYSKVSGKPGICSTHAAGAAHLALGLYEAYLSGNPVIAITTAGDPSLSWRPSTGQVPPAETLRPVTKWSVQAQSVSTLPAVIERAFRVATTGRPGPVGVVVPDIFMAEEGEFSPPSGGDREYQLSRLAPGEAPIREAARLLSEAERPVILAGGGTVYSRAHAELRRVAELLGIPVTTSHGAHGVFPGTHPLNVGVLGGAAGSRAPLVFRVIDEADVVLVVGSRVAALTPRGDAVLSARHRIIQIDVDPEEIGQDVAVEVPIIADAKLALAAVTEALRPYADKQLAADRERRLREVTAMVDAWRAEFTPTMTSKAKPIRTPYLLRQIQEFANSDTIFAFDAGGASHWAPSYLDLAPENLALHPRGFAALGSGLPLALGAQVAAPDKRVISISGDVGFGYNVMELETAIRLRLPVVNIVLNNQHYGMERRGFLRYKGEIVPDALTLSPQDFRKIAQAYGCFGIRVEDPEEIGPAIQAALDSGLPAVVEVVTDPEDQDSEHWGTH